MSLVRDIVDERMLFSVEEQQTVTQVAARMTELNVGAIVVLSSGQLSGVFSERDLMRRVLLGRLDPDHTPVKEVMTRELATIEDSASVEQAEEAMRVNNCRHLPVLRNGRLTAFLSMRDLLNYELARKTEELHHMRAYIQSNA